MCDTHTHIHTKKFTENQIDETEGGESGRKQFRVKRLTLNRSEFENDK